MSISETDESSSLSRRRLSRGTSLSSSRRPTDSLLDRSNKAWKSKINQEFIIQSIRELEYISLVFQFFNEALRSENDKLSWRIILISSVVSFLTLLDFTDVYNEARFKQTFGWVRNITLSFLSMTTMLTASYIKKRQYVKRIKDLSARIKNIETLLSELEFELRLPLSQKRNYFDFLNAIKERLTSYQNTSDFVSPTEWSETLLNITRNHKVLTRGVYPWFVEGDDGDLIEDREFEDSVYESVIRQRSWCCRCFNPKKPVRETHMQPLLDNVEVVVSNGSDSVGSCTSRTTQKMGKNLSQICSENDKNADDAGADADDDDDDPDADAEAEEKLSIFNLVNSVKPKQQEMVAPRSTSTSTTTPTTTTPATPTTTTMTMETKK